jgi:hypothetical protein
MRLVRAPKDGGAATGHGGRDNQGGMNALRPALLAGLALIFACSNALAAFARDDLASAETVTSDKFNYILTTNNPATIRYAVILMPGGNGRLNPRMEGANLALAGGGNFLIRSRELFADSQFVAASTDATATPDRIMAIVRDLDRRFGTLAVYVIGTSRSTESTMALSKPLDGRVAGFVHTSSMNAISSLDPRGLKSRQLVVAHKLDACRVTSPSGAAASHAKFGTDFIEMEGGKSTGDDCEAYAHHGYYGIEKETVDKIKNWILAGK